MAMKFFRSLIIFGAAAFAGVGAAGPAAAQSSLDGRWSVLIVTEKGTCDRGYRYPIRISHGVIGHADPANSSFDIKGRVRGGGRVSVTVSRGTQSASGTGRLSRDSGSGTWHTTTNDCSGTWTAERRG